MNDEIPDEVRQVARKFDRGYYTHQIDELSDASALTAEDAGVWTKLAACGSPTYLHRPSGYGVVKGADGHSAIIKACQLTPAAIATKLVTLVEANENGYVRTGGMVDDETAMEWVEAFHSERYE